MSRRTSARRTACALACFAVFILVRKTARVQIVPSTTSQTQSYKVSRLGPEGTHRWAASSTKGKILVYITTHLSSQHYDFLEKCWPRLLATLPLFQQSDFMMFATKPNDASANRTLIHSVFARRGITLHTRPNPGYQEGAILALTEGFRNGWFQEYEWIIRVNPDVLIRNDTFILSSMKNDTVSGIFVDCFDRPCLIGSGCVDRLIHTDFFAIRPRVVVLDELLSAADITNAEDMATKAFSGIVRNGSDAWLPDAGPPRGFCRVAGDRSPVIHLHDYVSKCSR